MTGHGLLQQPQPPHWHQQHYPPVSLNSPPPSSSYSSSTLTSSSSTLSSTSSSHSTCSTQPSQSPSRARRFTTHFAPATRPPATSSTSSSYYHNTRASSSTTSLSPPHRHYNHPQVLSSPDPTTAVRSERRSVRFAKVPGGVNWARPLGPTDQPDSYHQPPAIPEVPQVPPSAYNMQFAQFRRTSTSSGRASSAASTSSLDDSPLPVTPPVVMTLPAGASEAEPKSWAVACPDLKGLGISLPPVDPASLRVRVRDDEDGSRTSSDAGSLAGESTATASTGSSSPPTPTRLLFVSEHLDSLSKPSTLNELSRLRAAAAQLDQESKRLRRHRGRDPAATRAVPRKAVPALTEADMVAPVKPRRQAVRHSLIMPATNTSYSLMVEAPASQMPAAVVAPAPAQASPTRRTFMPFTSSSPASKARRQAFYSQGKAAQSVIEFGSRPKEDAASSLFPPPFLRSRNASGATVPTAAGGTRLGATPASPTVPGPPVMAAPLPVPVGTAPAPAPPAPVAHEAARSQVFLPPTPDVPRTLTAKPSNSFLNKHKKLSRFLGKSPVVA